jgi:hypothetical protein
MFATSGLVFPSRIKSYFFVNRIRAPPGGGAAAKGGYDPVRNKMLARRDFRTSLGIGYLYLDPIFAL